MRRSHRVTLLLSMLAAAAILLVGCTVEQSVFDAKGPVAEKQLSLIYLSFWIMMFVTAIVATILIIVLIRFRKRKGQEGIPKQTEGNVLLETAIVVIAATLLTILIIPTVRITYDLADAKTGADEALEVTVTAYQYWWEFKYEDYDIVTANELHIPVDTKIHLNLEAADVLHAFWVPKLAGKTDNIPGRTNFMWIQADEVGVYSGQCAEYCGPSHALMAFEVVAEEQEDFDAWVAKMQQPPAEMTSDLAQQGEEIFSQSCLSCHAIDATDTKEMAGPNLANFGDRNKLASGILDNDAESLKDWIQDPDSFKPGNKMGNLGIDDQQAEALVEYLHSLK